MHGLFWSVIRAAAWLPLAALAATATAANHSCGLIANGEVRCWGRNPERQLGNGPAGIGTNIATPVTVIGVNMDAAGLSFTSTDPSVVAVDNAGNAHAMALGTAMITAKYDSKRTTIVSTVAPDMNGSGIVTVADSGLLRARLNGLPGPSGLRPLCVSAATCSGSGP